MYYICTQIHTHTHTHIRSYQCVSGHVATGPGELTVEVGDEVRVEEAGQEERGEHGGTGGQGSNKF